MGQNCKVYRTMGYIKREICVPMTSGPGAEYRHKKQSDVCVEKYERRAVSHTNKIISLKCLIIKQSYPEIRRSMRAPREPQRVGIQIIVLF